MVAQTPVADRGHRTQLLLHVVPFARLGVPAVLAVAVAVHMAGAAGDAQFGARGGRDGCAEVRGPRIDDRTGGGSGRRGERVLVGLRASVEPHA